MEVAWILPPTQYPDQSNYADGVNEKRDQLGLPNTSQAFPTVALAKNDAGLFPLGDQTEQVADAIGVSPLVVVPAQAL